ncbi:peroxiredoxin-5, mitochondrial-like [Glossina fuscipes fuscipes]
MALFEDSLQNEINIRELTSNKKTIIFGVHGAFTPDCSKVIYVLIYTAALNDPFVMSVWGEEHGAGGRIRMLADPSGDFVQVLDLAMNLPTLGGLRSKRFSMIVGDTKVLKLNVEPDGTELGCSLAQNIVKSGIN